MKILRCNIFHDNDNIKILITVEIFPARRFVWVARQNQSKFIWKG